MEPNENRSDEAAAVTRVAEAARQVQAASAALEHHFSETRVGAAPALLLARLAATMDELRAARLEFDVLLASKNSIN